MSHHQVRRQAQSLFRFFRHDTEAMPATGAENFKDMKPVRMG